VSGRGLAGRGQRNTGRPGDGAAVRSIYRYRKPADVLHIEETLTGATSGWLMGRRSPVCRGAVNTAAQGARRAWRDLRLWPRGFLRRFDAGISRR
jgi:hypothetical protein